jgi:uncharacterized metal-binding protein YceD (DUF177 family)
MSESATGLTLPLRLAALPRGRAHPVHLRPDPQARAALAADLGILAVRKLDFAGTLEPDGRTGWRLAARLGATVVQACIVTGAPVTTRIDTDVRRRWLPDVDDAPGTEAELPDDVTVEPLRPLVDAGDVLREELSLALPDWPRAEGASLTGGEGPEPAAESPPEARPNPFAALAALRPKADTDDR